MVGVLLVLGFLMLAGCGDSATPGDAGSLTAAREACVAAATHRAAACSRQCPRFPDAERRDSCQEDCDRRVEDQAGLCRTATDRLSTCAESACFGEAARCREEASAAFRRCVDLCPPGALRCGAACESAGAAAEESCGFSATVIVAGDAEVAPLPAGRPADLSVLLDDAEVAVVEAADQRAEGLRSRGLRLWTGAPNASIRITQVEHDFRFGIPVDFREFEDADEDLAFYGSIGRAHANLLVAETSLKWRNVEREAGQISFDLADRELAWAEENGFDLKAHVLLWGNAPPVASGSGTPEWLRDRFPESVLGEPQAGELRGLIRERVETTVARYSGRIDVWEVTNEMLNPLTSWFATRLGPSIVDDAFRWARASDPGAELVYNEWISEIFTGLPGPDARDVRDRVLELLDAGVPIDAVGQQGHFAPGLVNVGVDVDLSERTRVDDYATALDTLAETGLPIHITEVTFAAPDEPEKRAAQAEAILRVWWGHPAVEEIIFWNFWNPLGPRSHLDLGVFGNDGKPTRHGEAILSLLNDRWRTRLDATTDDRGTIAFRATLGEYIAQWDTVAGPVHVRFRVRRGPDGLDVVAVAR